MNEISETSVFPLKDKVKSKKKALSSFKPTQRQSEGQIKIKKGLLFSEPTHISQTKIPRHFANWDGTPGQTLKPGRLVGLRLENFYQ